MLHFILILHQLVTASSLPQLLSPFANATESNTTATAAALRSHLDRSRRWLKNFNKTTNDNSPSLSDNNHNFISTLREYWWQLLFDGYNRENDNAAIVTSSSHSDDEEDNISRLIQSSMVDTSNSEQQDDTNGKIKPPGWLVSSNYPPVLSSVGSVAQRRLAFPGGARADDCACTSSSFCCSSVLVVHIIDKVCVPGCNIKPVLPRIPVINLLSPVRRAPCVQLSAHLLCPAAAVRLALQHLN